MKILLTVHYVIDTDRQEFWDSNSGHLKAEIDVVLKKRFPKKIKFSRMVYGQRYCLMHRSIDFPGANLVVCPICERLLTDRSKPNPIKGLDNVAELGGALMCKSCAWELELDVKMNGIEHVLNQFKK